MNKEIILSCWHRLVLLRQRCTGMAGTGSLSPQLCVWCCSVGDLLRVYRKQNCGISPRIIEPRSWPAQNTPPIPPYACGSHTYSLESLIIA